MFPFVCFVFFFFSFFFPFFVMLCDIILPKSIEKENKLCETFPDAATWCVSPERERERERVSEVRREGGRQRTREKELGPRTLALVDNPSVENCGRAKALLQFHSHARLISRKNAVLQFISAAKSIARRFYGRAARSSSRLRVIPRGESGKVANRLFPIETLFGFGKKKKEISFPK